MSLFSYLKDAVPCWRSLVWSQQPGGRLAVLNTIWSHHMQRSGYHPVAKGLGVMLDPHSMRLSPARLSQWMRRSELYAADQIAMAMKVTRRDRLLVVEGDFQLKLIELIRRVTSARIYAVFHQVPKVLEKRLAETSPELLDGAICVARCQIPFAESIAPPGKTWFVPHGVDTQYLTPRGPRSDRPSVLCVGLHCRDFHTLRRSADLIAKAVPSASVRLVAPYGLLPPELDLGRVELVTGLTDEQLLEEYRRAWVVLLPLTDATANNSLLEGMACGAPIVVSDIGGVRDYAGPECGALCPTHDAQAHGSATIELLLDPSKRRAAGQAARARAEICAWPLVQAKIRRI